MSSAIGASIGSELISKGIDQFSYGVSEEYDRYDREQDRDWSVEDQRYAWSYEMDQKMHKADEYGIHPLAMLGVSTSNSNWSSTGSSSASNPQGRMANMGQMAAQIKLMDAQQKKIEAETRAIEGQSLDLKQDNTIGGQPDLNAVVKRPPEATNQYSNRVVIQPKTETASMPGNPAHEAGSAPMYQYVAMPNGNLKQMISEKVSEPMESDWSSAWEHAGRTVLDAARDLSHLNNYDRNLTLMRARPPAPMLETQFRYNRTLRQWVLVADDGTNKIYTKKTRSIPWR